MIYAFDFDGTLADTKYPDILGPVPAMIVWAKRLRSQGNTLILWTCRDGKELDAAVQWCKEQGLDFDAINDNCDAIKQSFTTNPRKIYADYYVDDHNMVFVQPVGEGRGAYVSSVLVE